MIRNDNIVVDSDKCVACGICVDKCIMDNLRLSLPPCRQASPLDINWHGIMRLVAMEKFTDAAKELYRFAPLACLLEEEDLMDSASVCMRKRTGNESVDFFGVMRWLLDNCADSASPEGRAKHLPQKIAINGADAAFLQAAADLAKMGYNIDIYNPESPQGSNNPSIEQAFAQLKKLGANIVAAERTHRINPDDYDAILGQENPADDKNIFCFTKVLPKSMAKRLAEGRKMARLIRNFLEGFPLDYENDSRVANGLESFQGANLQNVQSMPKKHQDNQNLSREDVMEEAKRCLACGRPFEKNNACWYCLPCEAACPTGAIKVKMPYLIR